jgi:hypothetical protein
MWDGRGERAARFIPFRRGGSPPPSTAHPLQHWGRRCALHLCIRGRGAASPMPVATSCPDPATPSPSSGRFGPKGKGTGWAITR